MNKRMTIIIALIIILTSALILELVIVPPIYRQQWLKDRSIRQASYFQLRSSCELARSLYERTGIQISDFPHLSSTAFYPFEGTSAPCGGTFTLQILRDEGTIRWQGRWEGSELWVEVGPHSDDRIQALATSNDLRTHRLLSVYLKGSRWWMTLVEHLWAEQEQDMSEIITLLKKYCPSPIFRKEPPIALPFDIPQNEKELQTYQHWLSHIQGREILLDGWDQPVRLLLLHETLEGWSAGKDGRWNTSDDIRVVCRTMPP